jgi:hypothetical protein
MKHTISLLSLLIITLLSPLVFAFRFSLDSKAPSLSLTFEAKGKQTLSTVSSGQENHDVQVLIDYINPRTKEGQLLFNKTSNDLEFTYDYEEGSSINVTITSSTNNDRNVSFDFYSEDDPLVKMIDKRDIKYV